MRSDIKPCHCGKNAHMSEWQNGDELRYEVLCDDDNCRLGYLHTVGSFGSEQEAIDAWNAIAKRTCKNLTAHVDGNFDCSVCGGDGGFMYDDDFLRINYCPNCGARVEGD